MLENNIELDNTGEYIQNIFKTLIHRYCNIYSLNDTLFHKTAYETNVGLKQNRLSFADSQIFSSMLQSCTFQKKDYGNFEMVLYMPVGYCRATEQVYE